MNVLAKVDQKIEQDLYNFKIEMGEKIFMFNCIDQ